MAIDPNEIYEDIDNEIRDAQPGNTRRNTAKSIRGILKKLVGWVVSQNYTPGHEWIGTALRFIRADGTPGAAVDLKGPKGEKGEKPAHSWNGTSLTFEKPDGTPGASVNLRGPEGPQGPAGGVSDGSVTEPKLETSLRKKVTDTATLLPLSFSAAPIVQANKVVNDLNTFVRGANYGAKFTFFTTAEHGRASMTGFVERFRVDLTNAEVGRKVRFYVLTEVSAGAFKCTYDSGDVAAETAGINTFTPGSDVPILQNDVVGVYVNYISNANGLRFQDSGGPSISSGWSVNAPIAVGSSYGTGFTGDVQSAGRRFSVEVIISDANRRRALVMGHRNQANGFLSLDETGKLGVGMLPSNYADTSARIPTTNESTEYDVMLGGNKVVSRIPSKVNVLEIKSVLTVGTVAGFPGIRIMVPFKKDSPGFLEDGILTLLRFPPTLQARAADAKIQAWVVRPNQSLIGIANNTPNVIVSHVATIGEITASDNTKYAEFADLQIPVKAGDLIAFRVGAGSGMRYGDGSSEYTEYAYLETSISSDTTLGAISTQISMNAFHGRKFDYYAEVATGAVNQKGAGSGAIVRVGADNFLPQTAGRKADLPWFGKKIGWCGTSIPAGMSPSYPKQVGEKLGAIMDNQAVGSSGVVWAGNRALSLSATQAELSAAGFAPNQSYEVKLIGKNYDLLVFDHGYNDRGYSMGTIDSQDRSTFYGACNYLFDKLLTDNPTLKIVMGTSPSRYSLDGNDIAGNDAVRNATLALAAKWSFPVFDLMRHSGINAKNHNTWSYDKVHFTQPMTDRIAQMYYEFLKGVY